MNCPRTINLGLVVPLNHITILAVLIINEGPERSRRGQDVAEGQLRGLRPSHSSASDHSVPPVALISDHVTTESVVEHACKTRLCTVLTASSGRVALLPALKTRALIHWDDRVPASCDCMAFAAAVRAAEVSLLCSPWSRSSRWPLRCSPWGLWPLHASTVRVARKVPLRLPRWPLVPLLLGEDKDVLQLLARHVHIRICGCRVLALGLFQMAVRIICIHKVYVHRANHW